MTTTPPLAIERPARLCQRIEIDLELFRPAPLRRLRRALASCRASWANMARRVSALRLRRTLDRQRRRERPAAMMRHRVQLALSAARSDDERRRFSVGRVLSLTPVDGGLYEVRAPLVSKRSGGRVERCFLVRIDRGLWRRVFGRPFRVVVIGRDRAQRLAPLGRLAPGRRICAGPRTMAPLRAARSSPPRPTRRGFTSP